MYEPHYEEESGGGGFLIGLLCGTALGAAIGLMFAPKAGSEFRQTIVRLDRRHPAQGVRHLRSGERAGEQHGRRRAVRPSTAAARRSTTPGSRATRPAAATAATSDFGSSQSRSGVSDFSCRPPRTTGGVVSAAPAHHEPEGREQRAPRLFALGSWL